MSSVEAAPLVLQAGRTERHYWRDLWRYRELLGFLAWRDIKVRYKQAILGIGWALIQPLVTTAIITMVFSRLARMHAGDTPYPLLVLAGYLPWQFFSSALNGASGSLVSNANLISKIYFPRLLVPLSALGVALVDFVIVLGLFLFLALAYGYLPTWHWLLLPVFLMGALALAFGAGLWFTALTVRFRDFRFIVPFLLQIGVFISPVGYRTDYLPGWRSLLALNPMTGVIDGFRWCLLGGRQDLDSTSLACTVLCSILLVLTGISYFRRTERGFADLI